MQVLSPHPPRSDRREGVKWGYSVVFGCFRVVQQVYYLYVQESSTVLATPPAAFKYN